MLSAALSLGKHLVLSFIASGADDGCNGGKGEAVKAIVGSFPAAAVQDIHTAFPCQLSGTLSLPCSESSILLTSCVSLLSHAVDDMYDISEQLLKASGTEHLPTFLGGQSMGGL